MYVVILTYVKPIEEVEKVTAPHRDYLDAFFADGSFLVSGPQVPRTGGLIVAKSMERDKLMSIIENDPFYKEGIADYKVIEFNPLKHQKILKDLI